MALSHPYSGSAGYIYANNELVADVKTVERPLHGEKPYNHLKSFMPGTASMEVLSLTGPRVHSEAATVAPSSVSSPYSKTVASSEENELWSHDGSGWTKSFFGGRNVILHSDWTPPGSSPPGSSQWFDHLNPSNRGRLWPMHRKRMKKRMMKLMKRIRDSCMSGYRRGLSKL